MAGAGGFEPPPSALTVQRPTNWTTPHQHLTPACMEGPYCTTADSILIPLRLEESTSRQFTANPSNLLFYRCERAVGKVSGRSMGQTFNRRLKSEKGIGC